MAEVEGHPQRGLTLRSGGDRGRLGAPGQQQLHHPGVAGESRGVQERPTTRLGPHVGVETPVQQTLHPRNVTGEHRGEDVALRRRRPRPGFDGHAAHPIGQRNDGRQAER